MKLIKPSVDFFGEVPTDYLSALRLIEKAGRLCYKSEDKITENSAEKFVKGLIRAGHLAMVEHSNFVVRTSYVGTQTAELLAGKYLNVTSDGIHTYVGGNLTAWAQRAGIVLSAPLFNPFLRTYGFLFGLTNTGSCKYGEACPHDEIPKELHRYAVKFICDRGVSHEIVRHRPCSFAQESTRYVNYAGKDMEFIEPAGFENWSDFAQTLFKAACMYSQMTYNDLIANGLKPQQARAVLPNALKTEIIVTADAAEWAHIRKLRTAKDAHPDIQRVMNMIPWSNILKQ